MHNGPATLRDPARAASAATLTRQPPCSTATPMPLSSIRPAMRPCSQRALEVAPRFGRLILLLGDTGYPGQAAPDSSAIMTKGLTVTGRSRQPRSRRLERAPDHRATSWQLAVGDSSFSLDGLITHRFAPVQITRKPIALADERRVTIRWVSCSTGATTVDASLSDPFSRPAPRDSRSAGRAFRTATRDSVVAEAARDLVVASPRRSARVLSTRRRPRADNGDPAAALIVLAGAPLADQAAALEILQDARQARHQDRTTLGASWLAS